MRVLVLGGTGMVGHKLWQVLSKKFETWVTVRRPLCTTVRADLFDARKVVENVDAANFETVAHAIRLMAPEVVVNAIGVVKQISAIDDAVNTIKVNSLLPHELASLCRERSIRLIHISTDCVFSGRGGMYSESDAPDPVDFYGRSKLLGEVSVNGCLTLRTSVIGPELGSAKGLLGWFLESSKKTKILPGYTQAIFSGFTTLALAEIVGAIIAQEPQLSGLYHLSAEPIDKYRLLCLCRDAYDVPVDIRPCADIRVDRSLDSRRFRSATGFVPPSWPEMIASMSTDPMSPSPRSCS
jgi:dTDP-4-dehydrorhamnose reductase